MFAKQHIQPKSSLLYHIFSECCWQNSYNSRFFVMSFHLKIPSWEVPHQVAPLRSKPIQPQVELQRLGKMSYLEGLFVGDTVDGSEIPNNHRLDVSPCASSIIWCDVLPCCFMLFVFINGFFRKSMSRVSISPTYHRFACWICFVRGNKLIPIGTFSPCRGNDHIS